MIWRTGDPQPVNITTGQWSYCMGIQNDFSTNITIGNYCSIAEGCKVLVGPQAQHASILHFGAVANHPLDRTGYYDPRTLPFGSLRIGHDVWIGHGVTFVSCGDITIGNGAIIGAGAVVTKDVMSYTIVAGNPARLIKHRFPYKQWSIIEKVAWWNWSYEEISKRIDELRDVDVMIKKYNERLNQYSDTSPFTSPQEESDQT